MLKIGAACLALLTLTACAGRAPQLTPIVQVSDPQLSCAQIDAETKANNARMADLAVEQDWKLGQNAVAGIVGFMVWPAWLGLDFQNAAGKEATALSHRNAYLLTLAPDRCRTRTQTASARPSPQDEVMPSALATNAEIAASLVAR